MTALAPGRFGQSRHGVHQPGGLPKEDKRRFGVGSLLAQLVGCLLEERVHMRPQVGRYRRLMEVGVSLEPFAFPKVLRGVSEPLLFDEFHRSVDGTLGAPLPQHALISSASGLASYASRSVCA